MQVLVLCVAEEPALANGQLFHFHQFPYVPASIKVEPCDVLSISPGTDDKLLSTLKAAWLSKRKMMFMSVALPQ